MPVTRPPPPVEEETGVTDPVTAELESLQPPPVADAEVSGTGTAAAPVPGPVTPWAAVNTSEEDRPVQRGDSIGRYVVLHEVGRGGMGVVYAAYDAELDRKVAIKVLRGSSGNAARDHDRQARLLREAQAMARVDHPNVLSVFDVGTFRNQVFVAMAFVDGTTLSGYIRDASHPWRETLDLFMAAGRGLAAAHAVGLVHRDFKPANVLLARDGRVFVTDFGLARLTSHEEPSSLPSAVEERLVADSPRSGLQAEMTREGAVVGTPTYMAPEQHVGQQANARSDQFAFCAALYWALWHKRPFEPSVLAAAAFRRHGGASTVPQRVAAGGAAALDQETVIAEPPREGRVPARIRRAVMRGLSLDPEARFPSMEALLSQLSLERRQTQARWAAAAAGFVLAATTTGFAWQRLVQKRAELCSGAPARLRGTWDDAVETSMRAAFARVAGERAALEADRASRALDEYAAKWSAGFREACEATRIRGEVDENMLSLRMLCLERRLKELDALTHLLQAPDEPLVEKAAEATANLSSVRQCQELETLHLLGRPEDPVRQKALEAVEAQLAQIRALRAAGRVRPAMPLAQSAVAAAQPLNYRPVEAEARLLLGYLEVSLSDVQSAERDLTEAFFLAEAGHDDYTKVQSASRLVWLLRDRPEKAMEWARHARSGLDRVGGSPDLEVGLLNNIATVHLQTAHYAEGLNALQQALAVVDRASGREFLRMDLMTNLGAAYLALGDRDKAVAAMREGLEMMTAIRGPDHPVHISTLRNLSLALAQQGDFRGANEAANRAVKIARERLVAESPRLAEALDSSGTVLLLERRPAEALEKFQRAAAIQTKALGPEALDLGYSLDGVGQALVELKRPKEALPHLERACKLLVGDPEQLAETQFHLAQALVAARAEIPRARGLALQARSGFLAANVPDKAQEVSRWLAEVRR
ncbi:MAG TPA: serine/threonine-protein kinase [Myxococcaceae bacterium]